MKLSFSKIVREVSWKEDFQRITWMVPTIKIRPKEKQPFVILSLYAVSFLEFFFQTS